MLLAGYVHLGSGDGEVAVERTSCRKGNDRVFLFLCLGGFQCIGQKHVCVEGIVLGLNYVLAVAIIDGHLHLCFLGKESSKVGTGGELILIVVFVGSLGYCLFYATEACSNHLTCGRERANVG